MEFLFGPAHGHFDASSARNASALDETSDQAIERVNTGIAVVVPFHIIDAVIASYEQKYASSERVQLEPDNIVNQWQWSRADAIRSAATVADTLSATLARYKTRAAHGQSLAAACLAATISDCLVAVIRLVDSHGQAVVRNNSRRGYVSVRHLQTRPDSGMISTCCCWREQSSG
jgi:hypothetical protein